MAESKRPNILEIELGAEMLSDLLHSQEDSAAGVLAEHDRERRYELVFEGFNQLWDELRTQYGDRLPRVLAQMTMARELELRSEVQRRERLERGRS